MAWAKIDDGWWAHPKVMELSLAASGLWARALSWSCHQRKDTVPRRFLAMVDADDIHAKELVDAGLWIECDAGWRIHDWSEYQERTLSEKRAEAGAKGGKASGEARREANGKQTEVASEADNEAGTLPVPSLPVPKPKRPPAGDRATRLPDDWRPEPEPELVKAIGGQKVAAEQFARFCDYWKAQPGSKGRKVDWQATWRNWLRRSEEFKPGGARGSPEPGPKREAEYGSEEWERKQRERQALTEQLIGG